jgi:DNA-binding NarL/FixJ family response regulator
VADRNEVKRGESGRDRVRVLVVQDHPLLASAIVKFLEDEADLTVIGVARSGHEAVALAAPDGADVVLVNYRLPDISGPAAAGMIRTAAPATAVVFHSGEDTEAALLDAIDSGAVGYLVKAATAAEIVEAVRRAARGEILIPAELFAKAIARQRKAAGQERERERLIADFTPRELEVLNLMADGLDTAGMAEELGIAQHTVEWHVRHVIEKLKVHSKLQAVVEAARKGLVQL